MEAQGRTASRTNALAREIEFEASRRCSASAEATYDVLADLQSHAEWGGERQPKGMRIVSIEAPEGPARVGTEFSSEGIDRMGRFTDRSVVTEANRPALLEFVTEAHLETKKVPVDWTIVHRYRVSPDGAGCTVTYSVRVLRISALPGPLATLRMPLLSGIVRTAWRSIAKRGVRNLVRLVEERAVDAHGRK
jgi:hypothetical protein